MKYGFPYRGGKGMIADWIVGILPRAERLYDVFCGGCAITHAAIVSKKFNLVFPSDMDIAAATLFIDAVNGKFRDERRWISRDDFNRLKYDDSFVQIVWSFGYDRRAYMYSRVIEPYKRACHYAIVFDEWKEIKELCPEVADDAYKTLEGITDIKQRRLAFGDAIVRKLKEIGDCGVVQNNPLYNSCHWKGGKKAHQSLQSMENLERLRGLEVLENLERLESLEGLQSLERLQRLENLERLRGLDYRDVEISGDAVIYCDPPYYGTNCICYKTGKFDNESFWKWVAENRNPVFVSEYNAPDGLWCVAERKKIQLAEQQVA